MSDQLPPPQVSQRVPSVTYYAELMMAPGPLQLNETGDNSYRTLYGRSWLLLQQARTGQLLLYASTDGAWQLTAVPGHPLIGHIMPGGSRRFTLAFDQAATPVVAYEDQAGVIRVTRWDPVLEAYIENASFPGHDPALLMDATLGGVVPDSDVVLFYLGPGRREVMARVQRENYSVPHVMHSYEEPVILDRAFPLAWRYQLLLSAADGGALPEALVSDLYPLAGSDSMRAGAGPLPGGAYLPVVMEVVGGPDAIRGSVGSLTGGEYATPVLSAEGHDAWGGAASAIPGGQYVYVILEEEVGPDTWAGAVGAIAGGQYVYVIIEPTLRADQVSAQVGSIKGGEYVSE